MILSFIVPVYNTEKYIKDCLDSLLAQDIPATEYEIICVNDGSTDNGLSILLDYQSKYENIKVLDQANAGVCVARNNGTAIAKGEYIWYIDADDLIAENCLNNLCNNYLNKDYDRVIIGNYLFENNEDLKSENLRINTSWKDSVVWRNVMKKQFLTDNNLHFYPGLVFGEDALFMFEVFLNSAETVETDNLIYYHRQVIGSASNNTSAEFSLTRVYSTLEEAKIVQKYYEDENCPYPQETANRLMVFLWGGLDTVAQMPKEQAKTYLEDLKKCGLYPYKTPPECTATKSYQLNRNDLFGNFFDWVYTHMHRPWGFHAMRILRKILKARSQKSK